MEAIASNPILDFNPNQLVEVRRLHSYDNVNKLTQDINIFEEWIKKQNHFNVKEFDREYLERYLIANKGSVERAKKRFEKLCTLRNLMPEFLQNFDIRNEFLLLSKISYHCVLPKPTKDNYRIVLSGIHSSDHNEYFDLLRYYRYVMVFIEYGLHHDYCAGYEFVMDSNNFTLGMLSKINPLIIHKAVTIFEAFGLRLKAIHLMSGSKLIDNMILILKQGLSEKLRHRIKVHTGLESLHECISKDILPVDFGGDEKSIKELSETNFKQLSSEEHIAAIKFMEGARTNETCRLSSEFNAEYSGMPGSFKTLCVD